MRSRLETWQKKRTFLHQSLKISAQERRLEKLHKEFTMKSHKDKISNSPVTLSKIGLFKSKKSNISENKGPSHHELLLSNASGSSWNILNYHLLNILAISSDSQLRTEVNALKHALQVFGPNSDKLPDLRNNEGKTKGQVYHGHCKHSNGTTYVMEWAIIDEKSKILAILQFDTHENFKYRKKPLKTGEKDNIQQHPKNVALLDHIQKKQEEAEEKVFRMFPNNNSIS